MSGSTSELRVRLVPWNRFKPSSKIIYWPFQGGTSFADRIFYVHFVLWLLCLCAHLFMCALWSPAGKGLTAWLSFVVSNCEFVIFPLVSLVSCGTWLYRFLIFAPLLTFIITYFWALWQPPPPLWQSMQFLYDVIKETRSVTMNIFRKKYFLFKSFVKIEISYIFTINMVSTAENCKEKWIILLKEVFIFSYW